MQGILGKRGSSGDHTLTIKRKKKEETTGITTLLYE